MKKSQSISSCSEALTLIKFMGFKMMKRCRNADIYRTTWDEVYKQIDQFGKVFVIDQMENNRSDATLAIIDRVKARCSHG